MPLPCILGVTTCCQTLCIQFESQSVHSASCVHALVVTFYTLHILYILYILCSIVTSCILGAVAIVCYDTECSPCVHSRYVTLLCIPLVYTYVLYKCTFFCCCDTCPYVVHCVHIVYTYVLRVAMLCPICSVLCCMYVPLQGDYSLY